MDFLRRNHRIRLPCSRVSWKTNFMCVSRCSPSLSIQRHLLMDAGTFQGFSQAHCEPMPLVFPPFSNTLHKIMFYYKAVCTRGKMNHGSKYDTREKNRPCCFIFMFTILYFHLAFLKITFFSHLSLYTSETFWEFVSSFIFHAVSLSNFTTDIFIFDNTEGDSCIKH